MVTPQQTAVTIVVPCYNQGAFVREAVASAQRQTYPHVGCIVVDDGSTDALTVQTLAQLAYEGVHVLRQENRGLSAARNAGIRASDTPFFVPLDADDRLRTTFVERLMPLLQRDARLGYAYSHAHLFGARRRVWRCPAYEPRRLLLHSLSTATAVVRRSAFDDVGGYAEDLRLGYEDWDFWLALLEAGYHGRCLPRILFEYRQHAPGQSMLGRLAAHRAELVQRMIAHHADLYRQLLPAPGMDDDRLFAEWQAAVELDLIERAMSWRLLRLFAPRVYRDRVPSAQLRQVKRSAAFRCIARVKATSVHRSYARLRYPELRRGSDLTT